MDYQKYRNKLKEIMDMSPDGTVPDSVVEEFHYYMRDNWGSESIKLYRYSPADYYNIRNFETGKLRLTNNGVLNDIYEGIPTDDVEITPIMVNSLSDLAHLKCFSEEHDNTLMWSHYADEHRGFCVEYDLSLLDHNNPILDHIFPVVYSSKRRIKTNISAIAKELHQLKQDIEENNIHDDDGYLSNTTPLFLSKGTAWAYEKEWRIVYTKAQIYEINEKELYHSIISFDCASRIYLGYRLNSVVKENLLEIVDRINSRRINSHLPQIRIYQAYLQQDSYDLNFRLISE